ncbi:MAG: alpha-galactosidase [Planctomycetota bacterium]
MPIRVAFIGAGSVGFCRRLAQDLLMVPELQDTVFALHDINRANLSMVAQLLKKDIKANKLPAKVVTSVNRRKALEGADYVINCTRIGGLDAFATDIDIPLKYGVDQCVGDTLCAGGIMYGQRNIPQVLAFLKDAKAVGNASRDGEMLFLNYANPMAMNTWAALDAYDAGDAIPTVGLCHGVEGGWKQIATALAHYHGDADDSGTIGQYGETKVPHRELVDIVCVGINHQTWYTKVLYKGREVGPDELLAAFEAHEALSETEKVRIDVLRRFGLYSTESNGHLSEYLPWYRKRPREIKNWISLNSWINGETGGYLRVCTEGRNWFETDFPKWLGEAGQPLDTWERSSEHGSYIIEARETGRPYRGHFNLRNGGIVTNLADDCVVEGPGYVDRTGFHMMEGHTLPQACAATCTASINVQRMAKDAAVAGDVTLLKQAMLHDPLVGAVCNPDEVWQMTDEMLVAQKPWLPNYAKAEFDAAAKRLKSPSVKTPSGSKNGAGATRQKVKSVAQLRKSKSSVMAADKGQDRDKGAGQPAGKRKRSAA